MEIIGFISIDDGNCLFNIKNIRAFLGVFSIWGVYKLKNRSVLIVLKEWIQKIGN